jgi:hypothetical protein
VTFTPGAAATNTMTLTRISTGSYTMSTTFTMANTYTFRAAGFTPANTTGATMVRVLQSTLTLSTTAIVFTQPIQIGQFTEATVTLTGTDLLRDVVISSTNAAVQLSLTGGAAFSTQASITLPIVNPPASTSATLYLRFAPRRAGIISEAIVVQSGAINRPLTVTGTGAADISNSEIRFAAITLLDNPIVTNGTVFINGTLGTNLYVSITNPPAGEPVLITPSEGCRFALGYLLNDGTSSSPSLTFFTTPQTSNAVTGFQLYVEAKGGSTAGQVQRTVTIQCGALTKTLVMTLSTVESKGIIPNDPYFSYTTTYPRQWYLSNPANPAISIHADLAWKIHKGSPQDIITVFDTGVENTHPDLLGKVSGIPPDLTADKPYHGTFVSGLLAASGDNGQGIAGVNWRANINAQGTQVGAPQEFSMDMNPNRRVANVSLINNIDAWSIDNDQPGTGKIKFSRGYYMYARRYYADAYKNDKVFVVAMSNDKISTSGSIGLTETGAPNSNPTVYPVGYSFGIIAVGASDRQDKRADFSQTGTHIDLVAPGVDIYSTSLNSSYSGNQGTSFSTPLVAGVASLMIGYSRAFGRELSNDDVENLLKLSADKVHAKTTGNPSGLYTYHKNFVPSNPLSWQDGWNEEMGHGRLNAYRALWYVKEGTLLNRDDDALPGSQGYEDIETPMTITIGDNLTNDFDVIRHEIRQRVTFPPFTNPYIWGNSADMDYDKNNNGKFGGYIPPEVHKFGFAGISGPNASGTYIYKNYLPFIHWCEVVPGSISSGSAIMRTYLYELRKPNNEPSVWYPPGITPNKVRFSYTIFARPQDPSDMPAATNALSMPPASPLAQAILKATQAELAAQDNHVTKNMSAKEAFSEIPTKVHISLAPNPTSNETTLIYDIPSTSTVELEMVDMLGQVQWRQQSETLTQGSYHKTISTATLSPGSYSLRLRLTDTTGQRTTKSILLHIIR